MAGDGGPPPAQIPTTTTQIQKVEVPPYLQDAYKETVDKARVISNMPYQAYGGQRVAGLSPNEMQAIGTVRNNQGVYLPGSVQASNVYGGVSGGATGLSGIQDENVDLSQVTSRGLPQIDMSAYMNPFTGNVIDLATADIQKAASQQEAAANRRAGTMGAFGGSGSALASSEIAKNALSEVAKTSAGLRKSGWDTAVQTALADRDADTNAIVANNKFGLDLGNLGLSTQGLRSSTEQAGLNARLNAAKALEEAGYRRQQGALTDATALQQAGGLERGITQQQLDNAYKDFLEQRDFPLKQVRTFADITTGVRDGSGTTYSNGQTLTPGPNQTSQMLGAGLGILGAGKLFGMYNRGGRIKMKGGYSTGGRINMRKRKKGAL